MAEKTLKYKPEQEKEDYFEDYARIAEEKKQKEKQKRKEKKERKQQKQILRDAGEIVSTDSDTDEDEMSHSSDHFVEKKIQVEDFEPQEDNFDHKSMKNLDKIIAKYENLIFIFNFLSILENNYYQNNFYIKKNR